MDAPNWITTLFTRHKFGWWFAAGWRTVKQRLWCGVADRDREPNIDKMVFGGKFRITRLVQLNHIAL